jgi:hypothetical protein
MYELHVRHILTSYTNVKSWTRITGMLLGKENSHKA